ncbi:MAG: hypothetical protein A2X52_17945 [Candidatus Rokubacteria bacterium GWC2_70_16]|nr:MAG: hypothetical protein A2X52_17945 [Candidatus Rokubacteria bacterium GWC2_70_16]
MPTRHLIIGGGTAGLNAIRTIREEDGGASEITLVSAERPYSRMVLPYYLGQSIAESHVFTATPASLAAWKVKALIGRRAAALDPEANAATLDDGTRVEYDDCLIATGSRAARPPIPGADGPGVHTFWTLEEARAVIAAVTPGSRVVVVGAGFISFTILNALLSRGARLTIVEVAPRILPRMVDDTCAGIVAQWLTRRGVALRTGVTLARIEERRGKRMLHVKKGDALQADAVIMATGIRTNLEWLRDSGIDMADGGQGGILVDDHLRSSIRNVYAAGDVARGRNLITGRAEVHAIEPTAQEHGRVVGANMAGRSVAYRGSLLMNIVEVCGLDVASFGLWDDAAAEVSTAVRPRRAQYRKLLFHGGRLTGAMICGPAQDIWTTNDVGILKGLVQSGVDLSAWKAHLERNPFDVKPAFMATRTPGRLLPQTVLGRPSNSPDLPQSVAAL